MGCYVLFYGVVNNGFFLCVGELMMGDYLCKVGMSCWLIGKMYMVVDVEGMVWLGLVFDFMIGVW